MKIERPAFELTRVYADGTQETPEIIPVGTMPWDTRMERRGFLGVGVGVASLLLLLDGKAIAQVTSSTTGKTENVTGKVPENSLRAHLAEVTALAISPNGKIMVSGSNDSGINLWSLPEGKLLATLEGHPNRPKTVFGVFKNRGEHRVLAIAISPAGKTLVSGYWDNTIKLWSLPEGKRLATLEGHQNHVKAIAISPDGKTLVSGSWDKTIKLWSLPKGKLFATFEGHSVNALAISPDGKTLASGSDDATIKLWLLPEGICLITLEGHKISVNALAISPDGKTLASGSGDQTIKLWSLPDGKLLATLEGHKNTVFALTISPNGKILASGSGDRTIRLWSLPDGALLSTLEGHKTSIYAVAISPDGKTLASGDGNGVIILWDLEARSFLSFLFDQKANQTDAISYNIYDKIMGRTVTYTLPCGSPIPPGAVCTCNCVPGTYRPLVPSGGGGYPSGGGTYCTCNKICTCIPVPSDRDVKEAFETTDPMTILQRLAELPIQQWRYKWDDTSVRHIGPMAQDFAAAFAVGEDDKHIHPVDAQGVAFAAIQGLYSLLKENEATTETLRAQLQQHREEGDALKARVEALEPSMPS